MEGNRDESERCIDLALKYLRNGDTGKALRFLQKGQKLYPSKKAEGKLEMFIRNRFN